MFIDVKEMRRSAKRCIVLNNRGRFVKRIPRNGAGVHQRLKEIFLLTQRNMDFGLTRVFRIWPARSNTFSEASMTAVSLVAMMPGNPTRMCSGTLTAWASPGRHASFSRLLTSSANSPLLLIGASKRKRIRFSLHRFNSARIRVRALSVVSVRLKLPERPDMSLMKPSSARTSGRPERPVSTVINML